MKAMSDLSVALNKQVIEFGRSIFSSMGEAQPGAFNKGYWNGRLMEWSMRRPDLKVNLFRLVDVLPTLTKNQQVADHVREYLGDSASQLHPALGWALSLSENRFGAAATAFAVRQGVEQMAGQFIAGHAPEEALRVLRKLRKNGFSFTVDLLGEFCVCEEEAASYLNRYLGALDVFGQQMPKWRESAPLVTGHPGDVSPVCISVKLSALYSQTSSLNFERSVDVLSDHLTSIARRARQVGGSIYVDAEDTGNNAIIYESFKRVFGSAEFRNFPYPGIVLQAYSKSAELRAKELLEFAKSRGAPIAVRLVKGAYWDLERVLSAQNHWEFPLFTKKESSDACFERLSRFLIDHRQHVFPAFGSHNIRSLSHACCYAESKGLTPKDFEIQVLYGMADPIAAAFRERGYLVRMYVPLGEVLPGMGYLVRRLLENTSNESFLRHTFFDDAEVSSLLNEPRDVEPEGA
jgi:RHH-type transcriptional regulator, proline utilization regulon repressor / proline dehydrogenase / delta 1-pyrroline-5-carboxylate dehydrogenase